jgi:hypothetical protein
VHPFRQEFDASSFHGVHRARIAFATPAWNPAFKHLVHNTNPQMSFRADKYKDDSTRDYRAPTNPGRRTSPTNSVLTHAVAYPSVLFHVCLVPSGVRSMSIGATCHICAVSSLSCACPGFRPSLPCSLMSGAHRSKSVPVQECRTFSRASKCLHRSVHSICHPFPSQSVLFLACRVLVWSVSRLHAPLWCM